MITDLELFNKIMTNHRKDHPNISVLQLLEDRVNFINTLWFTWSHSPEGVSFWNNLYITRFKTFDVFKSFMLKYLGLENNTFINLTLYI